VSGRTDSGIFATAAKPKNYFATAAKPMRLAIAGAGAWGTALAALAAQEGEAVAIWAREPEVVQEINVQHANSAYLAGISLPPSLQAVTDIEALAGAEAILLVCPAQNMRAVLAPLAPAIRPGTLLVNCAKGIERGSDALLTEIIAEAVPAAIPAVLSGPSFAEEVARGLPTAVTLAIKDPEAGTRLARRLQRPSFRPYLCDDLIGAQIGGAVKNVLAIACGIVEGRGLGHSARAALITRGFAEMLRFAIARGARAETLSGLSGLGDLVLTCQSAQSRNFALGVALGQGGRADHLLKARKTVAEGAYTAAALVELAQRHGVDMPISRAVDAILKGTLGVDAAIEALMTRPLTQE
jgi:glycerol-3-phosphate dehydrogenase (NAD(P)+)